MAKEMIDKLILILIGVSLLPTVFTAVGAVNWTVSLGGTELNLSFIGIIVAIVFGMLLVGYRLKLGGNR